MAALELPVRMALLGLLLAGSAASCPTQQYRCLEDARYRAVDGTCNNLERPWLGAGDTALLRLLPAQYGAGTSPRLSQSGSPLPSPRDIVAHLFPERNDPDFTVHMFTIWGQLISHDVSHNKVTRIYATGRCCDRVWQGLQGPENDARCYDIQVSAYDPFYSKFNVTCLPFERAGRANCQGEEGEQVSSVTHFVDASFLYGSSQDTLERLRLGQGGLLRHQLTEAGREFPPDVPDPEAFCGHKPCYDAGDDRVNQNPMLAALHVVFLREHNRVARILGELNSHWDDERLLQEARRIVIAEWQIISYRDWLQWLIEVVPGTDLVKQTGLQPPTSLPSTAYKADVDPRTANDFTTATYRAFHNLVQGKFWLGTPCRHASTPLSRWFENTGPVLQVVGGLRRVVQGLVFQLSQFMDHYVDSQLTSEVRPSQGWGTDLISTDIQRGRDHGLPSYNDYRVYAGLPRAKVWEDFKDVLNATDVEKMSKLYETVDDVDFYVAGILERRNLTTLAGPSFHHIIQSQFDRWKDGDRFFYAYTGFPHSFSEDQLNALQNALGSRLLCDNVDGLKKVPRDIFLKLGHEGNKVVQCEDIPSIDFTAWKEYK